MRLGPFAVYHRQVHELTADEVHVQIVTTNTHQEDELHGHREADEVIIMMMNDNNNNEHWAADEVIISQLEHTAAAFDVIGGNSAAVD